MIKKMETSGGSNFGSSLRRGASGASGKRMKIIQVGKGKYRGSTSATLQRAVDAVAAAGGGAVEIPNGNYRMANALYLRGGVDIYAEGQVVLQKVPSVSSPIADYLGYGHYEFTVTQPSKFQVGMGVHLTDRNAMGFYETVATITGKQGNILFIDRMLNHDYHPHAEGRASTIFPLVAGHAVRDVKVRGLTLDGNPRETRALNGCRGGGVFLLDCHNIELQALEVRNYHGDAISFQQCTDLQVIGCHLHDNRGSGLHPGSGSVRYIFRGNRVQHNSGCGLYYCLRTKYSLCEDNVLEANGLAGISIGERDTHHLIRGNTIAGNGGPGILFRPITHQGGDDVLIENNRLERNCQSEQGEEIALTAGLKNVWISGNCVNDRRQPRQRTKRLTGPTAVPGDAARHLHIAKLAPWHSLA